MGVVAVCRFTASLWRTTASSPSTDGDPAAQKRLYNQLLECYKQNAEETQLAHFTHKLHEGRKRGAYSLYSLGYAAAAMTAIK
jgi:hypothetical protein